MQPAEEGREWIQAVARNMEKLEQVSYVLSLPIVWIAWSSLSFLVTLMFLIASPYMSQWISGSDNTTSPLPSLLASILMALVFLLCIVRAVLAANTLRSLWNTSLHAE